MTFRRGTALARRPLKQARFALDLPPGQWQVFWFGTLSWLPEASSALCIHTFFRGASDERGYAAILIRQVSLAHMVLLPIGTVIDGASELILGSHQSSRRSSRRSMTLDLSDANTEAILRSALTAEGPATAWQADPRYEGTLIRVRGTSECPEVLIPCATLFQFFWGISSTLTNAVLTGQLEAPERFIYHPRRTALDAVPPRFEVRHKWTDEEALYLVSLLMEPGAIEKGQRVFRRIAAASRMAELEGELGSLQLEVWPPFARPMKVTGDFYEVVNGEESEAPFLVLTHIAAVDLRPPCASLDLLRETGRRGPGAISTSTPPPPPPGPSRRRPVAGGKIEVQETPGGYGGTIELPLLASLNERFPGFKQVDVQKPTSEEPASAGERKPPRAVRGPWSAIQGSPRVGKTTRSAKLVGQENLSDEPQREAQVDQHYEEPIDEQLTHFRQLFLSPADHLTIGGATLSARVGFCDPYEELWDRSTPTYFKLPEDVEGESLTWLYRDPSCRHTKRGLCARVKVTDKDGTSHSRFIIELERRIPRHRAETEKREPVRSGLLVVWFDHELEPSMACRRLRQVLARAAVARTPAIKRRPASGVNVATLRHVENDLQQLAARAFAVLDQCKAPQASRTTAAA